VELSPERSIEVQRLLGSDIAMQMDECVRLPAERGDIERAMQLSLRWAERSKRAFETAPEGYMLFGIAQGGDVPELRQASARGLVDIGFHGYAIGGLAVGEPQAVMLAMIEEVAPILPADRPRYLMGVGTPTDIVESVARPLKEFSLSPNRLELEITESVLLTNEARTHDVLGRLRKLGASIALDDFGTGYSSLAYLRRFQFDKLKIDRAFVCDIDTQSQSFEMLRAIAALGETMEMTIIAEGVERLNQARMALLAGCRFGQGFYFARPMPLGDLLALIRRRAQKTPLAASA